MDVHRIDGIKFDLDRLNENELESIHGHLLTAHARVVGEIALIEGKLFEMKHEPLPYPGVEDNSSSYAEIADPETWARFTEFTRDV